MLSRYIPSMMQIRLNNNILNFAQLFGNIRPFLQKNRNYEN